LFAPALSSAVSSTASRVRLSARRIQELPPRLSSDKPTENASGSGAAAG